MNSYTARHCEERPGMKKMMAHFLQLLKFTSDEAISLHSLTKESFSKVSREPLAHELRARRLLRGFSSAQLSKAQIYLQRKLAMTNVVVMV